jgi:heptosyltransferase-2
VFRACPHIDDFFIYEKNGRHRGLAGKWRLAGELRKQHFDAAILLQNAFEAALITALAKIPCRGGYTTDGRRLLLTHPVRKRPGIDQIHQVHYYQEMVAGLGLDTGPDALELFLDTPALARARRQLDTALTRRVRGPVIGLNPGAAYGPAKRWPAEKYGKAAAMLVRKTGGLIVVFGTNADRGAARIIRNRVGEDGAVLDLTGTTDLATAMAHISQCDVFITNDSGLMHVAAARDTPLVAIFGSTDHNATGPFCARARVLRKDLPCSPCKKTHCAQGYFACMEEISASEVCAAVLELLEQREM